jgi:hypothetical protein
MKRKTYSVEKNVTAVKRHGLGTPAAENPPRLGIADQTFCRWE